MLCVDSWLGIFCEYNLISHVFICSIRPHPLKVVTLFAHSIYRFGRFICQAPVNSGTCYTFSILDSQYNQFIHTGFVGTTTK